MEMIWIGLGGFVGANVRYGMTRAITDRVNSIFPYGTFVVNLLGSLLIGLILTALLDRSGLSPVWRQVLVVGFLGGFTTFSSYSFEAIDLLERGEWPTALLYGVGSNALGLLACWLGVLIARATPLTG